MSTRICSPARNAKPHSHCASSSSPLPSSPLPRNAAYKEIQRVKRSRKQAEKEAEKTDEPEAVAAAAQGAAAAAAAADMQEGA